MKNREKFREEILSWVENSDPYCDLYCEFAKKNIIPSFTDCTNGGCGGVTCTWCRAVFALWLEEEYEEPPKPEVDWSKVPVDTLVRVRDYEDQDWVLGYFVRMDGKHPEYNFVTWADGRTSKTALYNENTYTWRYCELVEDKEVDEEGTMETEFKINSLEEPEQWWIFTFGCGHEHAGYYVKVFGTLRGARDKMFEKYGDKWAFQYSAVKWDELSKDPNLVWCMEKELEVIK